MAEGMKRKKIILTHLEKQGAQVVQTTKGWQVYLPDGNIVTMHRTESDHRAERNARSYVLRAGLTWPFDQQKRRK